MADRLALKRLTASDLTIFDVLLRRLDAGKQKAINLNADVFIGELYPAVPAAAAETQNKLSVALSLFGPDGKPAQELQRKIIKNETYKNWRLNGEVIHAPEGDSHRYDSLAPDDLAVMSFNGDPFPKGLAIVLISKASPADSLLHHLLAPLVKGKSMISITAGDIAAAISTAGIVGPHPLKDVIEDPQLEAAVEDAAQNGTKGTATLLAPRVGRNVSKAELARARMMADKIGREGEGLINAHLTALKKAGTVSEFEWRSNVNAIAPFDFQFRIGKSRWVKLDVKSTSGPFNNVMHISMNELVHAATGPERYDLYRIYEMDEDGGKLRVAEGVQAFAQDILDALTLPAGIRSDSFSIEVDAANLTWGPEQYIARPDGEED